VTTKTRHPTATDLTLDPEGVAEGRPRLCGGSLIAASSPRQLPDLREPVRHDHEAEARGLGLDHQEPRSVFRNVEIRFVVSIEHVLSRHDVQHRIASTVAAIKRVPSRK
jgi:hypothetical protein